MSRPKRYAALIIGVDPKKLAAKAQPEQLLHTPRGTVILDDQTVTASYHEKPGITIYAVSHYLDNDTFMVPCSAPASTRSATSIACPRSCAA